MNNRFTALLAAASCAAMIASPVIAQDQGTYDDNERSGGNAPDNYNFAGSWLTDLIGSTDDGSGEGSSWLDRITGIGDAIRDKYDAFQAERAAQRQQELANRQAAEAERLAAPRNYADLNQHEMHDFDMRLASMRDGIGDVIRDYAAVENSLWEQAHRIFADNRSFGFQGGGQNEEGRLTYIGQYESGYIAGTYVLTENTGPNSEFMTAGAFAGVSTRSGRVSGVYRTSPTQYQGTTYTERGNFSGQLSTNLSELFSGGFSCTDDCIPD
ncbi:DUF349 domain-containing protein [Aurantiacibacter xanthus]|uniref:DUF349 domain-containing protein n=1 Tax=Aurantiacibacter xanthus TaxID=1784712 RepID=A0A3A1P0L6_9SPHN|nr:DUF349 domain-containing protein [Aurantiacibacter xanthus]RIV82255.1 DUF349 domain-containing protein [Aurantiacibacter xanthus]